MSEFLKLSNLGNPVKIEYFRSTSGKNAWCICLLDVSTYQSHTANNGTPLLMLEEFIKK